MTYNTQYTGTTAENSHLRLKSGSFQSSSFLGFHLLFKVMKNFAHFFLCLHVLAHATINTGHFAYAQIIFMIFDNALLCTRCSNSNKQKGGALATPTVGLYGNMGKTLTC